MIQSMYMAWGSVFRSTRSFPVPRRPWPCSTTLTRNPYAGGLAIDVEGGHRRRLRRFQGHKGIPFASNIATATSIW